MRHPAQLFQAPRGIQRGIPLKQVLDRKAIALIGASFAAVHPSFDAHRFESMALEGLEPLGILPRGDHIAAALQAQLPKEVGALVGEILELAIRYGFARSCHNECRFVWLRFCVN